MKIRMRIRAIAIEASGDGAAEALAEALRSSGLVDAVSDAPLKVSADVSERAPRGRKAKRA